MAAKQPEPTLLVFPPGRLVHLEKEIVARVEEILISGRGEVKYKVVWWDGNTRKAEWVPDHEITSALELHKTSLKIGFRQ